MKIWELWALLGTPPPPSSYNFEIFQELANLAATIGKFENVASFLCIH